MLLSDIDILASIESGQLDITPFDKANLQPASYDVTLGEQFSYVPREGIFPDNRLPEKRRNGDDFLLPPGEVVLGHTVEVVELSVFVSGRVEGKSSMGRKGLLAHATAGFIDPGFSGQITLELYNLNRWPIRLTIGEPIAQICFMPMQNPPSEGYGAKKFGSHYQGQRGPVHAR